MNKFDTTEFNPSNVPLPSNDFFSFLDNEVYCIGALQNGESSRFVKLSEEVLTYDSFQKSKFLFKWKGNGYTICVADEPSVVLTLKPSNEQGKFFISAESYQNRADQIWELLPHKNEDNEIDGIAIRSVMKYFGSYIYIGWEKYNVTATIGMKNNTSLVLCPLSDWITFGMACMQYLRWSYYTDSDIGKAFKNYYSNIFVNISAENALLYENTGLIVNQNGGNFAKLNYVDVYMKDVACEVIAVCNAIRLATGDFDEINHDFFKLSLEFELSGLYKNSFKKLIVNTGSAFGIKSLSSISTADGAWGGDPDKIGSCLEAHNINFRKIHIKDQTPASKQKKAEAALKKADEELRDSKCAIISYNFSTLYQAIHTFACTYDSEKLITFNRHSDYSPNDNYLNRSIPDDKRGIYPSLSDIFKSEKDGRYYVGYFIE